MSKSKQSGKSRVTIKDVAKEAGVSVATVSYVLNNTPGQSISEDTRKKVLQFANILGYECNVMARYLSTGKTNTVGAVIKDVKPFASQYYLKLLAELSRLFNKRGIFLRLVDYDDGMETGSGCDAYLTLALDEVDFRTFADTKYVPVLAIDSAFDDFLFFRINDDFEHLSKKARRELKTDTVRLLTYALPQKVLERAAAYFVGVTVISSLDDIAKLDRREAYATVSHTLYDNVVDTSAVYLESSSFALKASAAAEATQKAIEHKICSDAEHDIRI